MNIYTHIAKQSCRKILPLYVPLLTVYLLATVLLYIYFVSVATNSVVSLTSLFDASISVYTFLSTTFLTTSCLILSHLYAHKHKHSTHWTSLKNDFWHNAMTLYGILSILGLFFLGYYTITAFSITLLQSWISLEISYINILKILIPFYFTSRLYYAIFFVCFDNSPFGEALQRSKKIDRCGPKNLFLTLLFTSLPFIVVYSVSLLLYEPKTAFYIILLTGPIHQIVLFITLFTVHEYNVTQHKLSQAYRICYYVRPIEKPFKPAYMYRKNIKP